MPATRRHRHAASLLLPALLSCITSFGTTPAFGAETGLSSEELFQRAFSSRGRQNQGVQSLQLPLLLDNVDAGLINAVVDPQGAAVDARALITVLEDVIEPRDIALIRSTADGNGRIRLDDLEKLGLNAVYDRAGLLIRMGVPAGKRKLGVISLLPRPKVRTDEILRPAPFSAFLNLRSAVDYLDTQLPTAGSGLQPLNLAFDGAVNVKGWVTEGDFSWRESPLRTGPWSRGDLRLVHDDTISKVRYRAGDYVLPVRGFQSALGVAGFTLAKAFEINPYEAYQPAPRSDFLLQSDSTVKVFLNGRQVQTLQLPAGRYSMRDLPVTAGANDVQLTIVDEAGREKSQQLDFFFDNRLLSKGTHDFGYGVGAPLTITGTHRAYDTENWIFSGFHRLGLTDSFTAGINLQVRDMQQVLGAEATMAMSPGTASAEFAASALDGVGSGYALRAQFRRQTPSILGGSSGSSFVAQFSALTEQFSPLSITAPSNRIARELAIRYATSLSEGASLSVSGLWQKDRLLGMVLFSNSATLRFRIARRTTFDITAERRILAYGRADYVGFAGLRVSFEKIRGDAALQYESPTRASIFETQASTGGPGNQLNGSLRLSDADDGRVAAATAAYYGSRFEATARHDHVQTIGNGATRQARSLVSFGTAIVTAGGSTSITRPVADSFFIVAPHPRIAGRRVGIDPLDNDYAAETDWLGKPALSGLTSYQYRSAAIDVIDLPPGYDVGNDRPVLLPSYRSGILVPIGTDAATAVIGMLIDSAGKPVTLTSGEITPRVAVKASYPFFTNRRGRFRTDGLLPGQYDLRLSGSARVIHSFVIKPDTDGIVDFGTINAGTP